MSDDLEEDIVLALRHDDPTLRVTMIFDFHFKKLPAFISI
jgi:hypothetical protein